MTADRDDELRSRFSALRAADAQRVPKFDAQPTIRTNGRTVAWIGGAFALAAGLALSFAWRAQEPEPDFPAVGTLDVMLRVSVAMPSDFLLDEESADVRRDAPAFPAESNDEVPFL